MVGTRAPRTPLPIEGQAVLKLCPRCIRFKGFGKRLGHHIDDCNGHKWRENLRQEEEEEIEVPEEPVVQVVNVGGRGVGRGINQMGRGNARGVLAVGQVVGAAHAVGNIIAEDDVYGRGRGRGHGHH